MRKANIKFIYALYISPVPAMFLVLLGTWDCGRDEDKQGHMHSNAALGWRADLGGGDAYQRYQDSRKIISDI